MKQMFLMSLALFTLCTGNAMATPKDGFGINIGAAGHVMNSTYTVGSLANPLGSTATYNSSGMSLGMDYQIVYTEQLTLNPFLMVSNESTNLATPTDAVMAHNILGFQGRYWQGEFFVGVHGALYTESISSNTGTSSASETGSGQGIVVGWEPSHSNWSVMLQGDSAKIKYSNQDVNWNGARLSIGYRWK
jgi:hypothetical protein